MSQLLCCALMLSAAVSQAGEQKAGPVQARLVARKTTYTLNLGGLSAGEYRPARRCPRPRWI
jgi:hypothetical protein